MATRNETFVESDLSGETDAAKLTFGLADTWYEIDLTEEERKQLEGLLKPYLKAGRKSVPEKRPPRRRAPLMTPEEREEVRRWARENTNVEFADYGQIPNKVLALYDEAHGITRAKPAKNADA